MFLRCLIIFCILHASACRAVDVVKHIERQKAVNPQNDYFAKVLELALEQTVDTFGAYSLKPIDWKMFQGRQIQSVKQGTLDIMWTMTSAEREKELLPIRIPLTKGLIGYRVFMIRKGEENKFKQFDNLFSLVALQGHDWPDTDILRHNGLRVETTSLYENLFQFLHDGYVDYVPRGVLEAYGELDENEHLNISVESSVLLHYPTAVYFFVAKERKRLAIRIKLGLKKAINDGSFDKLLFEHPTHKPIWKRLKSRQRRLIQIDNPLLPKATPLEKSEYWLSFNDFPQE